MDAITDREEVPTSVSMSGYKGGTYNVDEGSLYFIGATCGEKRYYPYTQSQMESYYSAHQVENYFDLFTGMFCQPGAPSYSAFTVDSNTITVNSYKVLRGQEPILFNTFYIKRTKEHGTSQSIKQTIKNGGVAKVFYACLLYTSPSPRDCS